MDKFHEKHRPPKLIQWRINKLNGTLATKEAESIFNYLIRKKKKEENTKFCVFMVNFTSLKEEMLNILSGLLRKLRLEGITF